MKRKNVAEHIYYDLTSTEGDKCYHRLMNVAFFRDTVVNSMNIWIPANRSRKLVVELKNAEFSQKCKKAAGTCGLSDFLKSSEEGTHTGAFMIGYQL